MDDENSTSSSTYFSDCEYYAIQNYTDRTLSITVQFLNESVFNFQSESSFQNRGTNGLVFETKYESKKVVIHLHQSTLLLHMQGASCIKWFECIFNNIAMEIHNIHDSALFSEENYIAQSSTLDTSERDVVTQHDNRYFDRECCLYKCNRNTMWCQHSNALINPQDTLYK
jgi:hypothetical protein